ncbi:DMT family transporter [Siccirubricoccus sp. G192]|uniref:DMT family transporter n=1 Tax=Siccirubricoccus sp. G192 TaxID=2849651 RepID=UPI001C2BF023|nr:DMT family transporter [Siccirubricoccus sp. G192]MBV1800234.1 DMT family transporter [Siccirubricoccus sp. G192]
MLRRFGPFVFVGLWSGGFTAVRLGLEHAEPLTLQALRYLVVVAGLLPLAALLRLRPPRGALLRHLLLMGLVVQFGYFAACNLAQFWGMTAGGLALLIALQPVLVALLAPGLAGEAVGGRAWVGLLLGLAGAAAVILSGSAVRAEGWLGLGFAVAALGTMTAGALLEKHGGQPCHPVMANLVLYAVGLLATLPVAALTETMRVDWAPGLVLPLAYLVLANSLIATSLLLAMIRHGGAARVSALFFLVPPLAALIAWGVLGEVMAPLAWAGTALAAVGVALARRAG